MAKKSKEIQNNDKRPPIVTFLGHVDHGKTTILDQIRKSSVQDKEVGGITQGISVYSVKAKGNAITFIDTPGHEAFDLMRSRGGDVADIVLLIVAANDGVKPQTKESIEIIKNSKTPCIVVLNKIDLTGVDIEKVKRELSVEGIQVESMGGDIPCVEVSGKTGQGIDDLIDMIQLVYEMKTPSIEKLPEGVTGVATVLETIKDKSMGNVSTIIVTGGCFNSGTFVVYQKDDCTKIEKIKGFVTEEQSNVCDVVAGYGGKLIGISEVLDAGSLIYSANNKKIKINDLFESKVCAESDSKSEESSEDEMDLLSAMLGGEDVNKDDLPTLNVVIKASSQGALQAILSSIEKINAEGELITVANSGVGNVTLGDVEYAQNLGAIVVGFEVSVDKVASELAAKSKILVKSYDLIYSLLDELEDTGIALQAPTEEEEVVGTAEIRQIFELSNGSKVLGLRVLSGEIKNGLSVRVLRDEDEVMNGKIKSMKCEKDQTNVVKTGNECGIVLDSKGDPEVGDLVECFRIVKL